MAALATGLARQDCVAQGGGGSTQPPERVIHLWVDPLYGNDAYVNGAGTPWGNPSSTTTGCTTGETAPNLVLDASGAVLLNAAWPLKTVTAALGYIYAATGAAPGTPPLPYAPQGAVVWQHAIIHCMPGVYGAMTPHPDNGILGNGEPFPIALPPNVSIQGTSAMNTLFFAGALPTSVGPVFEFGTTTSFDGENTFVDKVSISGVLQEPTEGMLKRSDAAVYIGADKASEPTLSNCFIYRNFVGVLVAASGETPEPLVQHHGVKLVNNTFAFNRIGLWNGQDIPPTTPASGWSKLIAIDNIFDGGEPTTAQCTLPPSFGTVAAWRGGSVGFEGVPPADLSVVTGAGPVDFNAYEERYYDTGVPILANLPPTGMRPAATRPGTPGFNISPITGRTALGIGPDRGALYLRDLFCNMAAYGNPALGLPAGTIFFDFSPTDFRLAPNTSLATRDTSGYMVAPGALNALVDAGWSTVPATMGNGLVMAHAPGHLPLTGSSQNTWAHHGWEADAEGFGNQRIFDHPAYPTERVIDLGADEVASFIIGGMRSATTAFMKSRTSPPPAAPVDADNHFFWYFGPIGTITPHTGQPAHRAYRWLADPPAPAAANYTIAQASAAYAPPWSAWSWSGRASPRPTYTATMVDISPHLLPDIHPWWPQFLPGMPNSNPVWQSCAPYTGIYNPTLYMDPTSAVTHPPGTYAGRASYWQWLDLSVGWDSTNDPRTNGEQRSFIPQSTPPWRLLIDRFDTWCRGVFPGGYPGVTYDTLPPTYTTIGAGTSALTLRYSFEDSHFSAPPVGTNVQSVMILVKQGD